MGTGPGVKLPIVNPYVGPRPFTREEAGLFFGRDQEARDLLSLVVSEQLVLFYAQSGAGKSSLINTRLVPGLEERNFEILPIGRVSGDVLKSDECDNIFAFNLFTHLDQSKTNPLRFAQLKLVDFLANIVQEEERFIYADPAAQITAPVTQAEIDTAAILPRVLVIDQFEEIVTTHPEAWKKRADFFLQVAEAMQADPYLWVVLVMREDFVATLDPFAHLLPNQLRARFYMRRMEKVAALEAVRRPVEKLRPFDTGIAEMLVDNLLLVSGAQDQPGANPVYGEFIEPVQLQVVCFQLWASLMKESDTLAPGKRITQRDIDALSKGKGESLAQFINKALGDFYEQAVRKVLERFPGKVSEFEMRSWFSDQLITEAETRGFVYQGKTHTEGLPNEVVNLLASQYIIRPENRPGGTWFELVHDRFIGTIVQSNRNWMALNQSRLLTDAKSWRDAGRPPAMLYEGNLLESAQIEIEQRGSAISDLEKEFTMAAALAYKRRRELQLRVITVGVVVLIAVLSGFSLWAFYSAGEARRALSTAESANLIAQRARDEALSAQATVLAQNAALIDARLTEQSQNALIEAQMTEQIEKAAQQAKNQYDSISLLQTQVAPFLNAPQSTPTFRPTEIPSTSGQPTVTIEFIIPVTGGDGDPVATPTQVPLPTFTPVPSPTTESIERRLVIGKSVNGQDIEVYQFGKGPRHIVFVGGLHAGYGPSTVTIADKMIAYLRQVGPRLSPAITVDVIRNANPDSLTTRDLSSMVQGRLNANGVDINANWDCYWTKDATWTSYRVRINGGESAFSEPETVVLRDYILGNFTVAVIVWESHAVAGNAISPGGCGDFSVFSEPLRDQFASGSGYVASEYAPYNETGAMVDWLDSKGIPAVSVYLPDLLQVSNKVFESQVLGLEAILKSLLQAAN